MLNHIPHAPHVPLLLMLAFFALIAPLSGQSPCCDPPPRPGLVLLDDMWVPASVLTGDGTIDGNPWTNDNVYIYFDSSVNSTRRAFFRVALHQLEAVCGVSFIELSSPTGNYIRVRPSNDSGVSSSEVGMVGGEQELRIWSTHWTETVIVMHEVMHALGFKHEQSRPDRDTYVTINWPFIEAGREHNFQLATGATTTGSYDFLSIMHYRATAFTIVPNVPTIVCKAAYQNFQNQIGNRVFLSTGDCNALQSVYGQPSIPIVSSISPSSAYAGSGSVTITVTGSWFYGGPITSAEELGSQVTINGVAVPTTFIDNHTLQATIPSGNLQSAGALTVRVRNHNEAGGISTSSALFNVLCASVSAQRGRAVAGLGDVNGDGYDDYAVGWPGEFSQTGRVVVHSGIDTSTIWQVTGPSTNSGFGYALANIGDVNNDGENDLLIGSPFHNGLRGRFEIRSGANGSQLALVFGNTAGEYLGNAVSAAGDVDGDGDLDFLVGAPGANSSTGRAELWSSNGGLMRSHVGLSSNDLFGFALSGGHDMTGDGSPDYVVGAPLAEGGGALRGQAYVYSGATGNLVTTKSGDGNYDRFGTSVAVMERIGATAGTADFVVGAPESGASGTGASLGAGYVRWFRGGGSFFIPNNNWTTLATLVGSSVGDCFGQSVASAGDIDDDGRTDIIVGAMQDGEGPSLPAGDGYAELWSPSTNVKFFRYELPNFGPNPNLGGRRGFSVSLIGDANKDGRFDYVVGAPETDVPCQGAGSVSVFGAPVPPALGRVLITEVSSYEPDAVELTNYGSTSINLNSWVLRWHDGNAMHESSPLNITLLPGEIAVVLEPGTTPSEIPAGVQVITRLPSIATTSGDFSVGLVTPTGHVVDEVRVARASTGTFLDQGVGGKFRGYAANDQSGVILFSVNVERANGLDSNSGGDWYTTLRRSLGLENACSGDRGLDPVPLSRIRINEIDTFPDFVELKNGNTAVDVANWYLLASNGQNGAHVVVRPDWESRITFNLWAPDYFLVLGDQTTPPAELPVTAGYLNVGSPGFPWTTLEFDVALYDNYGRVVDHVRATQQDRTVAHNHPRAPAGPRDFRGAALVATTTDSAIGRNAFGWDFDSGRDWRAMTTRTMGAPNSGPGSSFYPGGPEGIDMRLNSTRGGGGMTFIVNAGFAYAGRPWSMTYTVGHLNGLGPIAGLGPDATNNWLSLLMTPPFSGVLDSEGSVRIDVPAGVLPPGIATDNLIMIHFPTGAIEIISPIFEYDS